ncbi:lectin-like domain-containing protein [Luteolibacter marinus]|uniref:lectin-like domain-containing protein n=1 Tax=Luteolibacter marinus TaxID=2776705 RepID=UPI001868DC36|nr:hypothetical protein [Luteolibacter marinus]
MSRNTRLWALAATSLLAGELHAAGTTFTYSAYRFFPVSNRGQAVATTGSKLMQISEFQFFYEGAQVDPLSATVTSSSTNHPPGEAPPFVSDGDINTKWLNYDYTPGTTLVFTFAGPTSIDSYNYITGGDAPERDPVSWRIEGSSDGGATWEVLDVVNRFPASPTRKVTASSTNFELPAAPPPVINNFEFYNLEQSVIVSDGSAMEFFAYTALADTVTLDYPGGTPIDVTDANEGAYILVDPVPSGTDTVFTLTASSAGTDTTASTTVRSVAGGDLSYQQVRYTPIQLRTGGTTIQLEDFKFTNDGIEVVPVAVTNPGGSNAPDAAEGVQKLIDEHDYNNLPPTTPAPTKWLSANLSPVIFDFGASPVTFDAYSFVTGNDFPDRDPVKWIMEGSNDGGATWELIENVTSITYNTPTFRNTPTPSIPFPGASLKPAVLSFASTAKLSLPGDPITLSWNVIGTNDGTVTLDPAVGTFTATGGSVEVNPTADTTYTLTAVAPGGGVSISTIFVHVLDNASGIINYPDFDIADDISLVGNAKIINDSLQFPLSGDHKRLRLTSFTNGVQGSAWYFSPVPLASGFVTEFEPQITHPGYINGADGLAFTIHNAPEGSVASPGGQLYFNSNSLSVVMDSYKNATDASFATVQVWLNGTRLAEVDLVALGLNKGGLYMGTSSTYTDPYHVRVEYAAGQLDVSVGGTPVITDLAVDLSGVLDEEGKAYAGFSARTGGLSEYHDIVNWTLTPLTAAGDGPRLLNHVLDLDAGTLELTWSSDAGTDYIVTTSPDLVSEWLPLTGTPVPGTAGQTTTTVTIPAGTKGFFRVEEAE